MIRCSKSMGSIFNLDLVLQLVYERNATLRKEIQFAKKMCVSAIIPLQRRGYLPWLRYYAHRIHTKTTDMPRPVPARLALPYQPIHWIPVPGSPWVCSRGLRLPSDLCSLAATPHARSTDRYPDRKHILRLHTAVRAAGR